MTAIQEHTLVRDESLRARAAKVVPGGMFGHMNAANLPPGMPQFFSRGQGCRIWDADGNEYIDFLCSFGPIVLGHRHPKVEAAAARQAALVDTVNGPGEVLVELAELLVATVPFAGWALFQRNGTDATTLCTMIARAATGRRKLLRARGAYHGASPGWTPYTALTTPDDQAHQINYIYNDLRSVEAAVEAAGDDLAAIIASPYRHDAKFEQELCDPAFASGLRAICDRTGAVLILDDVRCGFRFDLGGSWEPIGVRPDLSAYSKAIANGYALSAVLGSERLREAASRVYNTGSFWCSAVPMAAAIATITVLREEDGIRAMEHAGTLLRRGFDEQARAHGVGIHQTGPVQMPQLTFTADTNFERANLFSSEAAARGVYLHPWHNGFLSAAHTDEDIQQALERTNEAFAAVRRRFGAE